MKVRAWDEKNKKMIYSKDIYENDILPEVYVPVFDGDGNLIILNVDEDDKELPIMIFTGYKDKNGKEIYEGDIVEFDDIREEGDVYREAYDIKNVAEVELYMGRFQLTNFAEDDTEVINGMNSYWYNEEWHDFMSEQLTVLGNIYENRDLLPLEERIMKIY
ncbi:YopX family protein [Peptostreptococcus porci]|uniref:YopX family protein n=1 Tax=Peptostreptococcus porci TaxID=2652282 RepID=UPI002A8408A8|nr:YopX family protein [Peptostreptococcus porci]MDY4128830.1 YopX family protein [Peptostreptococcus porci]